MSNHFPSQLLTHVVRPVLSFIGLSGPASEMLVIGTAAQESQFSAIMQIGGGPAVSMWQMEPNTVRDTWARIPPKYADAIEALLVTQVKVSHRSVISILNRLPGDLYLGAAMCRLIYYIKPFQLTDISSWPSYKWAEYIAGIWKRYYNTPQGAGTVEQFITNWNRFDLDSLWSVK